MADPIFTLSSTNPFGLSNVGGDASPAFVDIDGDSDWDVFIGNDAGNVLFFRNTGTINNPAFAAPTTNPFGLSDVGFSSSPSLVDIDHDGDLDALIGNDDGNMLFFRNTGSANNPAFAAPSTNPFGLVDVGYSSKPAFADIDGDGDLDVFFCSYGNDVQFFRNTGTASNPAFTAESTTFGLSSYYYSELVFVDIDEDGDLDAFEGFDGHFSIDTLFYRNIGTSLNPVFDDPSSTPFGLTKIDLRASPSFVDIDNDGDLDGFIGGRDGNAAFFVNDGLLAASTAGNNVLTGTPSPNDTATYAAAGSRVSVSLLITTQQNTLGAGLDTLTNIENLIGSTFNDDLTGDAKSNLLSGGAGNDTLRGWNGADTMNGGAGNDSYFVENAGDKVVETANQGTDSVNSRVTYALPPNVENLTLTGTPAINGSGNGLANGIVGNAGSNQLNGLAGNDILSGGGGNDILVGGAGRNILTGGIGNDIFRFTALGNTGTVTDYNVANDTIQLENSVFTALTATGTLPASQFRVGAQAVDGNDHVIYNKTSGALIYDANGNGAGAGVQIGTLDPGLNLTHLDIAVI